VLTYHRTVQGPPVHSSRSRTASAELSTAAVVTTPAAGDSPLSQSEEALQELGDYRATLANAYEWMWYAGFNGLDPLIADAQAQAPVGRSASSDPHKSKRTSGTASSSVSPAQAQAQVPIGGEGGRSPSPSPAAPSSPVIEPSLREEAMAAVVGDDEAVEDFEEHFHSSRMSVFEGAPAPATAAIVAADVFPLSAAEITEQMISPDPNMSSALFDTSVAPTEGDTAPAALSADVMIDDGQEKGCAAAVLTDSPGDKAATDQESPSKPQKRTKADAQGVKGRVDFPYPLGWIRAHVEALQQLAVELGSLVPMMKKAHREDRGFRASPFKKQPEWQALPVNLHYQLLAVRPHVSDSTAEVRTDIVHSVSCGAMTPHMLGHKHGGLYFQESKLVATKLELEKAKLTYTQRVAMAGHRCISTAPTESYGVYKRLCDIGNKTLTFESLCLQVCHRRAYAISQALSIAVNSLLLKIGLALQGAVPERVCEQWMSCGMLLVFEGLLSVVAHERSMLEDTISAVDALRSFQVRLLAYPDEPENAAGAPSAASAGSPENQRQSAQKARPLDMGGLGEDLPVPPSLAKKGDEEPGSTPAVTTDESPGAAPSPDGSPRKLKLELKGREVLVYAPATSLRKLPQSYRHAVYHKGGAVIHFHPVLFTQVRAILYRWFMRAAALSLAVVPLCSVRDDLPKLP
jgi:hypothetical protein